ncbi:MAG: hypothetical protein M4579_002948 [Chaenotheca gracillima]|nr:MAG: hypothetical protein M4579_002948 [Chaenotheca gracillima]
MEQMSHQSLESMANHYSEPVMNQVIDPALEPTFEPSIPQVAVKDTGKTKKKGPVPTNRKIPAHYDEANQEDRMLWDERQAGTPWVVVRAEWERITGEKVGASTLPNRYDRIRSNFSKLKPDDEAIFIKTLTDLEAKFALEKWSKVAAELEEQHGTIKYPPKVLEKAWKEISERSES